MIQLKTMNKNILKNRRLLSLFSVLLILGLFTYLDSSKVAFAIDDPLTVTLNVTSGIAITSPVDIAMSRNLTMAAMTAVGTTTWNVKTNNVTGYNLTIKATSTPAMTSGANSVANYQTGAPNTWAVTSGAAAFGFSVFGSDVATATWGTGSSCSGAADVPSASLKYMGFTTTTSTPVLANRVTTTAFAGTDTTVCLAVEQNAFYIPSGTYTATIIATAVTI